MRHAKFQGALEYAGCTLTATIMAIAWAVGFASLVATCGCGGSAMRTQASAAYATGVVIREARGAIEVRLKGDLQACVEAAALECVDATEARYRPIVDAHSAAVGAHQAWALALLAAVETDGDLDAAQVVGLIATVLRAYAIAREAASDIGLQLPSLPEASP